MKTIKQSVYFNASPHDVFELLVDSKEHAAFTGAEATVSRKTGGRFTAYDGWIDGKNLDIVTDKRIVQAWRGKDWQPGYFSRVEFKLTKKGKGCQLIFVHRGVPDSKYRDINQGWKHNYWEKMKEYLKGK